MSRSSRLSGCVVILVFSIAGQLTSSGPASAAVTREEVERAIRDGVRFLKSQQQRRRLVARRRERSARPAPPAW